MFDSLHRPGTALSWPFRAVRAGFGRVVKGIVQDALEPVFGVR
jgi:hypothetical protein